VSGTRATALKAKVNVTEAPVCTGFGDAPTIPVDAALLTVSVPFTKAIV